MPYTYHLNDAITTTVFLAMTLIFNQFQGNRNSLLKFPVLPV